jgi:hypothetical protein
MYYLVYKTVNKINGKFYIGAHRTNNMNDSYLGSGVALNLAIKKYGIENFFREIIYVAKDESDMFEVEKQLIAENIGENCYNLMPGGMGGFDHINSRGMHIGDKNCMRNDEIKKRVIDSSKITKNKNKEKYLNIAKENLKKAVEANTGKKRPDQSKHMREWAKQYWIENKEKIRDILSSFFELTSPTGIVYNTNRLQDFCNQHELSYTTIWKTSITNKPVKKGKCKSWICKKI